MLSNLKVNALKTRALNWYNHTGLQRFSRLSQTDPLHKTLPPFFVEILYNPGCQSQTLVSCHCNTAQAENPQSVDMLG